MKQTESPMQIVTASLKYLISIIIVLTIAHSDINTELQKALKNKSVGIPLVHKKQTIKFSDINQGTLVRNIDETDQYEILPNLKTNVNIQIDGMVTTTTVDQVFTNDSDEPMEAIYVFPLPLDAAVNDMKMIINDRFIQGIIKEKEEAKKTYEKAKKEGKRASLTSQSRPNIFTNKVANIMPNDTIVVRLQFVNKLYYENGKFQLRFPMVVAPRYIPGSKIKGYSGTGWSYDTDRVEDASKITPPVLKKGMRSGNEVSIGIDIRPGLPIQSLMSPSHDITTTKPNKETYHIELLNKDEIPNKDFVLEYSIKSGKEPSAALFTSERDGNNYFMLLAVPPVEPVVHDIIPRNITFILDVSGSMTGSSIKQAKEGLVFALKRLNKEDSFNIITFNNAYDLFSYAPLEATLDNLNLAYNYISNLRADGGTEALGALTAGMEVTKSNKLDMIIFLTDGSVGNEHEIIRAVDKYLGKTRLFSVGIGSAPNSYVLEEASKRGRGTFTYIGDLSQVSAKMSELFSKIESPVITDMHLNLSAKTETYPNPLPDLFKNEPVIVFGKIEDKGDQSAILTGRINNEVVSLDIPIFFSSGVKNPAISTLWARAKIKNKMNDFILGNAASKKEIIDLAIDFNIMSKFTSFVAVEQKIVNPSGKSLASALPTELPDGWNFDKVFGKNSPMTLSALPHTATNKPFYLLIGLLLISLSVLVRFTRANSI